MITDNLEISCMVIQMTEEKTFEFGYGKQDDKVWYSAIISKCKETGRYYLTVYKDTATNNPLFTIQDIIINGVLDDFTDLGTR